MSRIFKNPLTELIEYTEMEQSLINGKGPIHVSGCMDSQKVHLMNEAGEGIPWKLIITYDESRAKEIYEDFLCFRQDVWLYPAKDLLFYSADIHGNLITKQRVQVLRHLMEDAEGVVITTIDGLMDYLVSLEQIRKQILHLAAGRNLDLDEWKRSLVALGYERVPQVDGMGQFSVRGGILDVFPFTEELPFRIELWDTEVDSIRTFDLESQRSVEQLEEITVYPAGELNLDKSQNFLDYFPEGCSCVFLDEPARIREKCETVELEFRESMTHRLEKGYVNSEQMDLVHSAKMILEQVQRPHMMMLTGLEQKLPGMTVNKKYSLNVKNVNSYQNSFEVLLKDLKYWKKNQYRVVLLSGSRTRASRLAGDLRDYDLHAYCPDDPEHSVQPGEILVTYGNLHRGFEYPQIKFVVITEGDMFGKEKKKRKRKRTTFEGKKINSFTELSIGDYVVHEEHGLGIYRGIEKIERDKVIKDYLTIEYAASGKLYLPATRLDGIQKYASADAKAPKLNKLGGEQWNRTKARVSHAVREIARDLVELYAKRQESEGFQYEADTVWQKEFEELFPYEETEDQLAAIEDTKRDMESRKIMDRLICGDVGYGKTEIAIRAAFKAVQEGKQVVYLVPTTILAQQHYNTFVQRVKDFPVRVDLMSRFRTGAEQKKTIQDLKKGWVDIVIGTHRLLSNDIGFKDLGLLIVDEEQRFGVTHKEKIKKLKENVDVLTLTATPIPRTLHMSLVGIRDMSVLEEPPVDRMPIQTYVMEYNDEIVREAINRELARGGQVYYVYNRVKDIEEVAFRVQELVPDATVVFAHGQMPTNQLERIMLDFINGDIDVLVSTTIIETGLDISNANTMIIHDADRMGLSQLYQLRGRVGRSSRTSYAFLMYKRDKLLKEEAEKRLQAIREFTELGSGIKIAMRDLEIRGAGNVLGAEQHGHMEAVGYDLYCKMLNQAVLALRGKSPAEGNFETVVDCDIDAFIPSSYIRNEYQKLDIYKRISGIENEDEYLDMQDELMDRFGEIPKPVDNLLRIAMLKALAHAAFVTEVNINSQEIRLTMYKDARLDARRLPELVESYCGDLRLHMTEVPYFLYIDRKKQTTESMMDKGKIILEDIGKLRE